MKLLLLVTLIGFSITINAQTKSKVNELDANAFFTEISSIPNRLLLDVRPMANYEKNRIAGAIWIDGGNALTNMADTTDKETPVFIYCQVGKRSRAASEDLVKKGFMNVSHLKFGLDDYLAKGHVVDTSKFQTLTPNP